MAPLVIYATIYTLYSVVVILREFCRAKQPLPKELRTFYMGHILNVIIFNISWIPA